jgi:lysophospholipase L1-like esterase
VLVTLVMLAAALAGLELYAERWHWPVADSWYRVHEEGGTVTFGCQDYAPVAFPVVPERTRIVMLGGSTAFGFPLRPKGEVPIAHHYGVAGAMEAALEAGWPGRYELVDLGVNGGASEDSLRLMRRARAWHASAVVVYDGHNEFVSLPARFSARLHRFALYRRFVSVLPPVTSAPGAVGPPSYGTAAHADAVRALFAANLAEIVAIARVPVVVSTQASNLSDLDPSWSTPEGDAEGSWRQGRRDADAAKLRAARDLDGLPLRATSAMNAVIRGLPGVTVVDAEAVLPPVAGDESFWDWVHPRPEAAAAMADALLDGLRRAGVLAAPAPPARHPPITSDEAAEAERRTAVAWLQWACVRRHDPTWRLEHSRVAARRLLALRPDDADAIAILAVADAVGSGRRVAVPAAQRERLSRVHACVAAAME